MGFYMLFLQVLNMSLTASIVIGAVFLARLLLKDAPKVFSYVLWTVVLFRLLCPVTFSTELSLLNFLNTPVTNTGRIEYIQSNFSYSKNPQMDVSLPEENENINEKPTEGESQFITDPKKSAISVITFIWLGGIMAMLIYSSASLMNLKRKLIGSVPIGNNIYLADHIVSPFVMGLFNPKIYLPSALPEKEQTYIIKHEQHHIGRLDHIVKISAFAALCIHWFNPFVWVAFVLSGKDMEMSCDEAVMKGMDCDIRADYSTSLLSLATGRKIIAGAPLAFGEGDTKGRIKNIMNHKKPGTWAIFAAMVLLVTFCVMLITNPISKQTTMMGANYQVGTLLYDTDTSELDYMLSYPEYCITADFHLYCRAAVDKGWEYIGELEPYSLTKKELEGYTANDNSRTSDYHVREVTDSYILRLDNNYFYLAFQTKDGKTFLGFGWEDISERGQGASDDTCLYVLYKLKTEFRDRHINANFFDRSLVHLVGANVNCFCYLESDDIPGYLIVGFMSGESKILSEMNDMGFAVLQSTGEGYKLLDYHVYTDAALSENGIYICEHPAVADMDGYITDDNTYDVILSCNEDLATITRIVREGKEEKKQTRTVDSLYSMTLFSREDEIKGKKVELYFYDKSGRDIVGFNSQ